MNKHYPLETRKPSSKCIKQENQLRRFHSKPVSPGPMCMNSEYLLQAAHAGLIDIHPEGCQELLISHELKPP